jgi:hypothetical protein
VKSSKDLGVLLLVLRCYGVKDEEGRRGTLGEAEGLNI